MTKSDAHLSHVENGFFFPQKGEPICQQILKYSSGASCPFLYPLYHLHLTSSTRLVHFLHSMEAVRSQISVTKTRQAALVSELQ
jgi:hypothetical protein